MLSENRKYNFIGQLVLHKSRVLTEQSQPKDDEVNWLFLNMGERQFSFVYKIEKPFEAKYDKPFTAALAFLMIEAVEKVIQLNQTYEILRGQEVIGTVKPIRFLK